LKKDATELALKSDSLTAALKKNQAYILAIQKVLTGKLDYAKFNKDSILAATEDTIQKVNLSATQEELDLRDQVAAEEKKSLPKTSKKKKAK
jgi:hypothetical protein